MIHRCAHRPRIALLSCCALGCLALAASPAQSAVTIYVDDDAAPGGDGLTWNTAFPRLKTALAYATNPLHYVTEIRVAQGTYKPDETAGAPNGTGDRHATFQLVNGVAVRGGYAGIAPGASDPDERDFNTYQTILSGDLLEDDAGDFQNIYDNAYHVVTANGLNGGTLLEGFTITAGTSGEYGTYNAGSAILMVQTQLVIAHCNIMLNYTPNSPSGALYAVQSYFALSDSSLTQNYAAAVYLEFASHASITDCLFDENSYSGIVGDLLTDLTIDGCTFTNQNIAVDSESSVDVSNSHFAANTYGVVGTQLDISTSTFENHLCAIGTAGDGPVEITGCTFTNNSGWRGAAIDHDGGSIELNITDCTFTGNSADDGGAIYNRNGDAVIKNCAFDSNIASGSGGAIYNGWSSEPLVINCTFRNNFASVQGGAVYNAGSGASHLITPALYNCVFFQNTAGERGGAVYSRFAVTKIVNCTLVQNDALFGGGAFTASNAALKVYNSIVKANTGGSFRGQGERIVRYSNITGGHPGIGNLDGSAKFVDFANGDLRLMANSLCIDAGRKSYVPFIVNTDADGNLRCVDNPATLNTGVGSPPVDMGAYEYQP